MIAMNECPIPTLIRDELTDQITQKGILPRHGNVMKRPILIYFLLVAVAFAGDSSVTTTDGNKISGITAVARTGDEYVGIRYPEGLMQVEIAKLPDSFLKSWNIERGRPKDEAKNGAEGHTAKTFEVVKKEYVDGAIGAVVGYSLTIIPETHFIYFDGMSTEKRGEHDTPVLWVHLQFNEARLDAVLKIIEKFEALLNTGSAKAELLGTAGANIFYFSPANGGVLVGKTRNGDEDDGGVMMRMEKPDGITPIAFLAPDEIDMLHGFLVRFKAGEFNPLIER